MNSIVRKKIWRPALLFLMLVSLNHSISNAADQSNLEEIVVNFQVPKLINTDIFVWYDGTTVLVPVKETFTLMGLKCNYNRVQQTLSGFLFSENNKFEIDVESKTVRYQDKTTILDPATYFLTETDFFLSVDLFKLIFDIEYKFSFSALSVYTKFNKDLPLFKQLKRKKEQRKLIKKEKELRDIQRIAAKKKYFAGGVMDWAVVATPVNGNEQLFSANLGAIILGGDINVSITGSSATGIRKEQIDYRWHYYIDNGNRYVTQVEFGHIYSAGFLARGLYGGLITNQPQIRRKFYKTINVNGVLAAGWEVELYINNKLTAFTNTDDQGNYEFDIDVFYGSTTLMLKMYGPNGQYLTEEKELNVPYNLIPKGTVEYSLLAGKSDFFDSEEKYIQANGHYGIKQNFTIGLVGDLPIGSKEIDTTLKPTFGSEVTWQPFGNLTTGGFFSPGYASGFRVNFSKPSSININGSVTKYVEGSSRNRINQQLGGKIAIGLPIRLKGRHLTLRYMISYDKYASHNSINMNYGLNTSLYLFHINYIGRYQSNRYANRKSNIATSQFIISSYLLRSFQPQLRIVYDHSTNEVQKWGGHVGRRIFRSGQISLNYDKDNRSGVNTIAMTLSFFTGFANSKTRVFQVRDETTVTQIQRGSVKYDQDAKSFSFDRRNGVGYGAAVVRPFLDDNNNGRIDYGEKEITGLRARIRGGRQKTVNDGKFYYYDGLLAYDNYLLTVDETSLNDPTLKPAHENYQISVNPNSVTTVSVPIVRTAEISGRIERLLPSGKAGIGGIKLNLMNLSNDQLTEVTTFSSGDFYYLGLMPGSYTIYIDPVQLEDLGFRSEPENITMDINTSGKSDFLEEINFLLIPNN